MIDHIPCYVLTVEGENGKRRAHADNQLSSLGLTASFIRGFKKDDPSIYDQYDRLSNRLCSKRDLTSGEIAVYCGHRSIWRAFLSTPHSCALVFEDDFSVTDGHRFSAAVRDGIEHSDTWDILKFFDFKPKPVIESRMINSTRIVRYKYAAAGAVAYLIDRSAAEKLLSRDRFFRAIDEDFSWPWELGLSVWSVSPNLVEEVSHTLGGSLLEEDRLHRRRQKSVVRALWGNAVQTYKLIRSKIHNLGIDINAGTERLRRSNPERMHVN